MDKEPIRIVELPTCHDIERGSLTVIDGIDVCPFEIKRVFYIHGAPFYAVRGGHSHKNCKQMLVMMSGCAIVNAGGTTYFMCSREQALYIPTGYRVDMTGWTDGAIMMVLASEHFDIEDYIYENKNE